MSAIYNEYIISSNNSINDNKYNDQKMAKSPSAKLKRMLKPILRMLRQKSKKTSITQECDDFCAYDNRKNSSIESCSACCCTHNDEVADFWAADECNDNSANEELESRIFHEIEQCADDAAVYVYEDDEAALRHIQPDQKYVPVHFARTDAGTFFWTTMQKPVDNDLVQPTYCYSDFQQPELQRGDRWVQA